MGTPPLTTVVRQKMSSTVQTGFHCTNCNVETVTYDGYAAPACLNCNTPNPKQTWQTIIRDTSTTEVLTPMAIAPMRST